MSSDSPAGCCMICKDGRSQRQHRRPYWSSEGWAGSGSPAAPRYPTTMPLATGRSCNRTRATPLQHALRRRDCDSRVVTPPVGADAGLAAQVPHLELDVLVSHSLHIEPNGCARGAAVAAASGVGAGGAGAAWSKGADTRAKELTAGRGGSVTLTKPATASADARRHWQPREQHQEPTAAAGGIAAAGGTHLGLSAPPRRRAAGLQRMSMRQAARPVTPAQ